MMHRFARTAAWLVMAALGLILALDVAYLVRGSLEEFPTTEQQSKVRVVTGVIAVLLTAAEVGVWLFLRRLRRRPVRHAVTADDLVVGRPRTPVTGHAAAGPSGAPARGRSDKRAPPRRG
jgi:nitrate reductase gamma subunit